jgi:basic membrane lipoprotein Med (substrate-binding protein (PBP1-ABC) superfamily)
VFDNSIQDASYLTGIVAGAMTKKKSIGMVGGYPIPEVNRLMNAFMAGVKETAPDTKFQVAFIGSWFDPPKAKETAFAQIDAGADVMYAERFGVSDAAKERSVLAIGNGSTPSPTIPRPWSPLRCGTSSRRSMPRSRPCRAAASRPMTTAPIPS